MNIIYSSMVIFFSLILWSFLLLIISNKFGDEK